MQKTDVDQVKKLVAAIRHRGPDHVGLWQSYDSHCALGHARLSIIDLSPAGYQPMVDSITGNTIAFNGEIYNFQQRRKECERDGYQFSSHTDSEVILALYQRHGKDCLKYLRGMFAFVIWDAKKEQLFMARDRVGKKPLNYAITSQGIIFCSEIDPLARHPDVSREMDHEALELYLQLQYIPAPQTIYQQVRKLPPAHYAIYSRKGLHIEKYWDVDYREKIKISEQNALEALEEKITEAVQLRMVSDVPLGALLSGGVDSSIIVALMAKLANEPIKTFSIGFQEQSHNELPYAAAVAESCSTEHHPKVIDGDVESMLPKIARHYGEPYADSSAVPSFHVCKYARNNVTVVLNGDGGDELLAGYPRYSLTSSTILSSRLFGNMYNPGRLANSINSIVQAESIRERAKRKWLLRITNPELQSLMYKSFWNANDRKSLLGNGTKVLNEWRESCLENVRSHANNAIERMLWIDNSTYLPGDLLVKMDIASMHCGLETRSPLLDHEVIEFCASLPVELKVKNRTGKYLLKRLAEKYYPKDFVYRQKMGFGSPLAGWLRGPLKGITHDILTDATIIEPFNASVIANTLHEFYKQDIDHSSRIWTMLMYGIWKNECLMDQC